MKSIRPNLSFAAAWPKSMLTLVLGVVILSACTPKPETPASASSTPEKNIARLSWDSKHRVPVVHSIHFSPDRSNVASMEVFWKNEETYELGPITLILNNKKIGQFANADLASNPYSPSPFSPAGDKLVYMTSDKERKKAPEGDFSYSETMNYRVHVVRVVNGSTEPDTSYGPYDSVSVYSLGFSSDGKTVGFVATRNGKSFVVANGKEGKYYDEIATLGNKQLWLLNNEYGPLYVARNGDDVFVVKGAEEFPAYEGKVNWIDMSEDGMHVAYGQGETVIWNGKIMSAESIASRGDLSDDGTLLVYKSGNSVRFATQQNPALSTTTLCEEDPFLLLGNNDLVCSARNTDAKQTLYRLKSNGEYSVLAGPLEKLLHRILVVSSPTGNTVALAFTQGSDGISDDYRYITFGSYQSPLYDAVSDIVIAPDDKNIAFRANLGESEFIVVNGQEGASYDQVWPPIFSPDGKSVVYGAKRGNDLLKIVHTPQ